MWTAILLAGQRPGLDPLAAAFGLTAKALVPVAGEAMVSRVARTLLACPEIGRVVILAQDPAALLDTPGTAWLAAEPRITLAPSKAGIAASVAAIAEQPEPGWPLLVTTADHVLLAPATIAGFIAAVGDTDAAVALVARDTVQRRFAATRRTWLTFRDGGFSGANLFALAGPAALPLVRVWSGVEADRKRGFALMMQLGPGLALGALLRLLTLHGAVVRLGRRHGVRLRAVVLDDAEAAVDVDSLADHALAEDVLARRP